MSIPGSNQFKRKFALVSRWVDLATRDAVVGGDRAGLLCSQERNELCGMRGKGPPLWCHPLWCHAQGQTNVFSENLRQGSVNMRSHFSYRVRTQQAHLSLCCAWAVFQVRDENENVPFVWNWSHCYLYETPFFFRSKRQKKRGLDFPFEKPEVIRVVITAGPWVDKTGLSTSSRMGFAKISKLRISINRKIFTSDKNKTVLINCYLNTNNKHPLSYNIQTNLCVCMYGWMFACEYAYLHMHTYTLYRHKYIHISIKGKSCWHSATVWRVNLQRPAAWGYSLFKQL